MALALPLRGGWWEGQRRAWDRGPPSCRRVRPSLEVLGGRTLVLLKRGWTYASAALRIRSGLAISLRGVSLCLQVPVSPRVGRVPNRSRSSPPQGRRQDGGQSRSRSSPPRVTLMRGGGAARTRGGRRRPRGILRTNVVQQEASSQVCGVCTFRNRK